MYISQLETIASLTQFGQLMGFLYIQLSTILNVLYLKVPKLCLLMLVLDAVYMIQRAIS